MTVGKLAMLHFLQKALVNKKIPMASFFNCMAIFKKVMISD